MPYREDARAKINLTLRVLGRRPDGYHEIESLVTFAEIGDVVTLSPGGDRRVTTSGPFAGHIEGRNLLERALDLLAALDPELRLGPIALEKNLPVAAGLGGGSADAAALLRAVRHANPQRAGRVPWHEVAAWLGADVPVCLAGTPALITGVGDRIEPLVAPGLPSMAAVLVNPRLPLSTAQVYRALGAGPLSPHRLSRGGEDRGEGAGPVPSALAAPFADLASLLDYVRHHGNDLQRPAVALLPAIAELEAALVAQPGCCLAAMSGSGPTCFGIFTDDAAAALAAATLASTCRGWWIAQTRLAGGPAPLSSPD